MMNHTQINFEPGHNTLCPYSLILQNGIFQKKLLFINKIEFAKKDKL